MPRAASAWRLSASRRYTVVLSTLASVASRVPAFNCAVATESVPLRWSATSIGDPLLLAGVEHREISSCHRINGVVLGLIDGSGGRSDAKARLLTPDRQIAGEERWDSQVFHTAITFLGGGQARAGGGEGRLPFRGSLQAVSKAERRHLDRRHHRRRVSRKHRRIGLRQSRQYGDQRDSKPADDSQWKPSRGKFSSMLPILAVRRRVVGVEYRGWARRPMDRPPCLMAMIGREHAILQTWPGFGKKEQLGRCSCDGDSGECERAWYDFVAMSTSMFRSFTPAATRGLEEARQVAARLGAAQVEPDHLLQALLEEDEGRAAQLSRSRPRSRRVSGKSWSKTPASPSRGSRRQPPMLGTRWKKSWPARESWPSNPRPIAPSPRSSFCSGLFWKKSQSAFS